ncbi:MAG: hypothetical protein E7I48_09370 [Clostridium celatum]|jgi:hypothetical protein|nr:hypothetical protein [Clostridium celatum]
MKKIFIKEDYVKNDFNESEVKDLFGVLIKYYEDNKKYCYDVIDGESVSPEDKASEFMLMYKKTVSNIFRRKEVIAFKNSITREYIFITTKGKRVI